MFKKLKEFFRKVSLERDVLIAWTFNKHYWRPSIVLVTPRPEIYREMIVQPKFEHIPILPTMVWNYGVLQGSNIVKGVKEAMV